MKRSYLVLLTLALMIGCSATAAIGGHGKWIADSEVSPMDDLTTFYLELDAEEKIEGLRKKITPTLYIRCRNNETDLFIALDTFLSVSRSGVSVATRLDSEKAEELDWSVMSNGKTVFIHKPVPFIRKMMKHDTLLVHVKPMVTDSHLLKFDIRGLSEAIKPICEACGWK